MKELMTCRRTFIAWSGIIALLLIAAELRLDTSNGIVAIVGFIAGSNALQSAVEAVSEVYLKNKAQKNDRDKPTV